MKARMLAAQTLACRWHWVAFALVGAAFVWEGVGLAGHYRLRASYRPR